MADPLDLDAYEAMARQNMGVHPDIVLALVARVRESEAETHEALTALGLEYEHNQEYLARVRELDAGLRKARDHGRGWVHWEPMVEMIDGLLGDVRVAGRDDEAGNPSINHHKHGVDDRGIPLAGRDEEIRDG